MHTYLALNYIVTYTAVLHFFFSGEAIGTYYHDDPVYGLNIHPEDNNVFLTASDDGKVMLWDIRTSPVSGKTPVHSVQLLLLSSSILFKIYAVKGSHEVFCGLY